MIGIYRIIDKNTNRTIYVGQSVDINRRFSQHRRKYPNENYSHLVVELCDTENLDNREIFWISEYNTYKNGDNQYPGPVINAMDIPEIREAHIKRMRENNPMFDKELCAQGWEDRKKKFGPSGGNRANDSQKAGARKNMLGPKNPGRILERCPVCGGGPMNAGSLFTHMRARH